MITIYYINLDREIERRIFIETNLKHYSNNSVEVKRVAAIDANTVSKMGVAGKIRDNEKGCFMSHKKAIELSLSDDKHALILEDDAMFGPNTFSVLSNLASTFGSNFDLLFTDVCIPDIKDMIDLFLLRRGLIQQQRGEILPLDKLKYAGATAYLVSNQSKRKIINLLNQITLYDAPYDLLLRQYIWEKKLKAFVTFPFITSLSSLSLNSQIQLSHDKLNNLAWDAFRRMMFVDAKGQVDDPLAGLKTIPSDFYDESAIEFSKLLQFMFSEKFGNAAVGLK